MRDYLKPYTGQRLAFSGVFDRFGNAFPDNRGQTVLLQNIQMDGTPVCDHCWVQQAENFVPADPMKGETIRFLAVVMPYRKLVPPGQHGGTYSYQSDYSLYRPTSVVLPERMAEPYPEPGPEVALDAIAPAPALPLQKPVARRRLDIIRDVQMLANELGGVTELRKVIDVLDH